MKHVLTLCLAASLAYSALSFAAEEEPNPTLYPLLEAEIALSRGLPEVAIQNYIAVAKETQDPKIAARATEIALSMDKLAEAVGPAIIWAKNAPTDIEAQLTAIALLLKTNQGTESTPYFEALFKLNDAEMDKEILGLYRQLGEDGAEKALLSELERLLKNHPKELTLHLAIAEINLFQGNLQATFDASSAALKLNPSLTRGILMHGQAMLGLKGQVATIDYLETQLAKYQKDFILRQFLIEVLLEQGQTDKAKAHLIILSKMPDISPNTLLHLSKMAIDTGWYDEAKALLLEAKKFDAQADSAHYLLARLSEIQKDTETAINWYQQVNNGPFYILSHTQASFLLANGGRFEEAISILENIEPQTDGDLIRVILTKADVLTKSRQYKNAYELLTQALRNYPDEIDFLYARSLIADKLGQLNAAEKDLKAILIQDSNHIDALNALGYILADKTNRFEEAEAYITQALNISPNNPSVMDSMGWLQFKRKKYDEAIKWLKMALEINPDPEIAAHLGEVLWYARKKEQAQEIWNQAIQAYPNHETLMSTMKRVMSSK
ncbi:MAG: tetratricopeptide repeat protein [Gammaproteobacteria bacterium]